MRESTAPFCKVVSAARSKQARWCAVGVDPGATGGVALLWSTGRAQTLKLDTRDALALYKALPLAGTAMRFAVAVEYLHAINVFNRSTNYNLGKAAGVCEAVARLWGHPLVLVGPLKWQALVPGESPKEKADRKRHYVEQAKARFHFNVLTSGEADALWLAWYISVSRFQVEAA